MKKLIFMFILIPFLSVAQNEQQFDCGTKILTVSTTSEARNLAKENISIGQVCIFVQGGIAPIIYPEDSKFEKRYKVKISDFGCSGIDGKISSSYNHEIFKFLDRKYGKKWRSELRKDVIGFNDYRKANK